MIKFNLTTIRWEFYYWLQNEASLSPKDVHPKLYWISMIDLSPILQLDPIQYLKSFQFGIGAGEVVCFGGGVIYLFLWVF